MTIQVFGTNCPNCKIFFDRVKQAVRELNFKADVQYINDLEKIIERGLMSTPALLLDDAVLLVGGGHSIEIIKNSLSGINESRNKTEGQGVCSVCAKH